MPPSIPEVKLPRPADVSANCEPEMKPSGRSRRGPRNQVPCTILREWQTPQRVGKQHRQAATFSMPLRNRFDRLSTLESEWGSVQRPDEAPLPPPRPTHHRRRLPHPRPAAREVSPARVRHEGGIRVQPHGNGYFLPGKITGKAVTFLLDSGCTTNLIGRRLFDTLSAKVQGEMEPYNGEYGTLANGSCIPFYGIIELTGRV